MRQAIFTFMLCAMLAAGAAAQTLDSMSVTDKAIAVMGVAAPANIISSLDNFLSRTEDKYSLYQVREAHIWLMIHPLIAIEKAAVNNGRKWTK